MPETPLCTLRLNGEPLACPPGTTLEALLEQRGDDPASLATALNGRFVPRAERCAAVLADGDELTFFKAIVGG